MKTIVRTLLLLVVVGLVGTNSWGIRGSSKSREVVEAKNFMKRYASNTSRAKFILGSGFARKDTIAFDPERKVINIGSNVNKVAFDFLKKLKSKVPKFKLLHIRIRNLHDVDFDVFNEDIDSVLVLNKPDQIITIEFFDEILRRCPNLSALFLTQDLTRVFIEGLGYTFFSDAYYCRSHIDMDLMNDRRLQLEAEKEQEMEVEPVLLGGGGCSSNIVSSDINCKNCDDEKCVGDTWDKENCLSCNAYSCK